MSKTSQHVIIYHNPTCSKSRETLALLESQGIEAEQIRYLDTPPTIAELKTLLSKLGMHSARELMRTKEDCYQALQLDNPDLSEAALLTAMQANPILIERPIVVTEQSARIGRPPESVLDILST
ncbi:arsenate reductase (glutaredoxin) [Utexia brackfieldae]|uniref:arsenate reductase (glutaredoxin) n=1 Tax=Utexia brackfieldae TaxID=3074108 RepID=UPI00370DD75A